MFGSRLFVRPPMPMLRALLAAASAIAVVDAVPKGGPLPPVREEWRQPCNVGQEWPSCENRMPSARLGL
eukprot:COSAG01_NODE_41021_length_456_cov_6.658263_1_plen_68_part_10